MLCLEVLITAYNCLPISVLCSTSTHNLLYGTQQKTPTGLTILQFLGGTLPLQTHHLMVQQMYFAYHCFSVFYCTPETEHKITYITQECL